MKGLAIAIGDGTADAALPAFQPLGRETLQMQAYLQLREALMAGRFKPGLTITLRAAAEALGVSPMPVRGALQRLEAEGALVARGQKRTLAIPELTAAELVELRDIRVLLEGLAAERAAGAVTPEALATVEAHCGLMQAASEAGDLDGYIRANWAFHSEVYRASRLDTLLGIVESLWLRIGPYVPLMMPDRDSLLASMPNHWNAVGALKAGNGGAAKRAIAADITQSAQHLASVLKRSG